MALVLVTALIGSGAAWKCGGPGDVTAQTSLRILKSSLAASPAVITGLVASGVLSQAVADGDIRDLTRGGTFAVTFGEQYIVCSSAVDRIPCLSRAAKTMANGWRGINAERVVRGAKTHPRVDQIFAVADGIFLFIEAFYSDQAGETPHEGSPAVDGLSEEEFHQELNQKVKVLEKLIKDE